LIEFALGGAPNKKDSATYPLEPMTTIINGTVRTGVEFTARNAFALSYQLEMMSTVNGVSTWQTLPQPLSATPLTADWNRYQFLDDSAWNGQTRILRLRVNFRVFE
jgi:hypothetical protein